MQKMLKKRSFRPIFAKIPSLNCFSFPCPELVEGAFCFSSVISHLPSTFSRSSLECRSVFLHYLCSIFALYVQSSTGHILDIY